MSAPDRGPRVWGGVRYQYLCASDDPLTEERAQAWWEAFKRNRPHAYQRLCAVLNGALDARDELSVA